MPAHATWVACAAIALATVPRTHAASLERDDQTDTAIAFAQQRTRPGAVQLIQFRLTKQSTLLHSCCVWVVDTTCLAPSWTKPC
jgi:hypothetical protein